MEKREVLIRLYNAKVESWKTTREWYGIIDENVLDTICRNEEMFEDIILDMIGCVDLDDRWKDYIDEVIYDLATRGQTGEGYANSVEELVDEILEANK